MNQVIGLEASSQYGSSHMQRSRSARPAEPSGATCNQRTCQLGSWLKKTNHYLKFFFVSFSPFPYSVSVWTPLCARGAGAVNTDCVLRTNLSFIVV